MTPAATLCKTLLIAICFMPLLGTACGISAAAPKADQPPKTKQSVKLFGQIDELSVFCSAAGLAISRDTPSTVIKVSPGSAASYSGVREGDKVIHVSVSDDMLVLDIERGGKRYQASIATDVAGLRSQFERRKMSFSVGDSASDKELMSLSNYQIVLLIDRSQSMDGNHAGCPGDLSKWSWCKEQIDNLFLATDRVLAGGFDLILFNDTYQVSHGVTLWDLRHTLDRVKPEGKHKNIAAPLQTALNEYFSKKGPTSKPCIIVVLTDGIENTGEPLQNVLIEASRREAHAGEVLVLLLQIGDSIAAEELFDDLDHNLMAKGARYHMANFKPFSELRNKGVLWELLAGIREQERLPFHKGTFSGETR